MRLRLDEVVEGLRQKVIQSVIGLLHKESGCPSHRSSNVKDQDYFL